MEHITYCTMCLGTEVKMKRMNSVMLKIYNELMSTTLTIQRNFDDMYACYECAYLLQKYTKFRTKCCKAYNILYSLSPESFEVTQEDLDNIIDRKQSGLVTKLTTHTFSYDYQPKQQQVCESNEQFTIEKDEIDTTTLDNNLNNDKDKDLLEMKNKEIELEEQLLDIQSTLEHDLEFDYEALHVESPVDFLNDDAQQVLNAQNAVEYENEVDYQFIDTFKVESSNHTSDMGSMVWLSIQSKESLDVSNSTPDTETPSELQADNECPNTAKKCIVLKNYLLIDSSKITGDTAETDLNPGTIAINELNERVQMELAEDKTKENGKKNYDNSETDIIDCISTLKERMLKDNMTVVDLTDEEAQHEFTQRKYSSNYTRNRYKCDLCYRGFISKNPYESHMQKHSSKYGTFQCKICKLCFIDKSYLTKHRIRTHKRKFSCNLCPYVCFSQSQCNAHILSHQSKEFTCKDCGLTYRFLNSLLTHMRLKHSVECVCEFCGGTYASQHGLASHKHMVHRQETNEHLGPLCQECDVHFANLLAWKRHKVLCARHKVQFGCKVCGDIFENSDALREHMRSKHVTLDHWSRKKYLVQTCVFCKVGLANKAELKKHMLSEHAADVSKDVIKATTQARASKHVCEYCSTKFTKRHALVEHRKKEHPDEMPYTCPDCGLTTKYKEYVTVHKKSNCEKREQLQCDICRKPFTDKVKLVRHMKGHVGIRPFKCSDCDKRFMFQHNARAHYMEVHEREALFIK